MDIIFIILSLVCIVIFSILSIESFTKSLYKGTGAFKFFSIPLAAAIGLFVWTCCAKGSYNPTPIIHDFPIKVMYNIPHYVNENGNIVELSGDAKFADPATTIIRIKIKPSGWKYGIYVSGHRHRELVKK